MLLLALQTTAAASDDRPIDAITLVLVVIFVVSMAAVSLLYFRRERADPPELPATAPPPDPITPPAPSTSPVRRERPLPAIDPIPAWLQGVNFSASDTSLSDAAQLIEALLAARRVHDLAGGLRLYSPEMLKSLRTRLGVDEAGLGEVLSQAQFDGDPPTLRSLDLIGSTTHRMTVRAGYANGATEIYRLVHLDGQWLIEGIAPS